MDEESTCRTCTRRQNSGLMSSLNPDVTSGSKASPRYMLQKCVPGMMLDISQNPMICQPCASKLNICYEFITNCRHVENMIISYLENNKDIQLGSLDLFKIINQNIWNSDNIKTDPITAADDNCISDLIEIENIKVEFDVKIEPTEDLNQDHPDDHVEENIIHNEDDYIDNEENIVDNDDENIDNDVEIIIENDGENNDDENIIDDDDYFNEEDDSSNFIPESSVIYSQIGEQNEPHNHSSDSEVAEKSNERGAVYSCNVCGYETSRKQTLKRHLMTHDSKSVDKGYRKRSFRCDMCQYKAYNRRLLETHKKNKCKKSQKVYSCNVCDYETPRGHSLKRHLMTHGGKRPFVCKHCDKGFVEQCVYKLHLLKHEDKERPHRCTECEAGFLRRGDLKVHMRRHGAEERFRCGRCNKTFGDKRALEAHQVFHNGKFKYNCNDCDFGTSWKKNLARHIEHVHS